MSVDIFLSYSRADRERVRPIVAQLEMKGWSVWWDRRLVPGEHWEVEIRNKLRNCRAVVVIWTKTSVKSMWVQLEASAGLEIDGLVPIQIDPFEVAPIPGKFQHLHTSDLTTWSKDPNHPELQSAFQVLREIVARPPTAPDLEATTDLAYSLSLGGDLGSSDPRDLGWIDHHVRQAGRRAVPALLAALQFVEPERRGHALRNPLISID